MLSEVFSSYTVFHFIGIGGIGMSALAQLVYSYGYIVQGSDVNINDNTEKLVKKGIIVFVGHHHSYVKDAHVVVYSSAIKSDNVEFCTAVISSKIVLHRVDLLLYFLRLKRVVCIVGSHGKTTTTGLISSILDYAGMDPTVLIGGVANSYNNNIKIGKGDWLIIEVDESDGKMMNISCDVAVITNIDLEHLDYYKSYNAIENAFLKFLKGVSKKGFIVLPDNIGANLLYNISCNKITYGFSSDNYVYAFNIRQEYNLIIFDIMVSFGIQCGLYTNIKLPIIGYHNVKNAAAAISVAIGLGISIKDAIKGVENFLGVQRRFSLLEEIMGIKFIDDYAHHPTEIEASLLSASCIAKGKVIGIIQPHRFTRIKYFFNDFIRVFTKCDYVILTNVYAAGEGEILHFSSNDLINSTKNQGFHNIVLMNTSAEIADFLSIIAQEGDVVIAMGAGNITNIFYDVIQRLKAFYV
ncbi:UDP-N-acetylmuramate--L-alanine ligase [Neoehrlichia mikurensis]|uniref:UDP-N-acetylmuramate--L-alanine ligase n=1 Tax=Neoehrlichia mikurensis TaxID=89586 RepID=A0A9Q9F650_9RICK|nr:UDP-N-acetylmuramate--L-alanine ligase [Neoehrlichia mikurensis]QXK92235.1 UDP-N-acetylmuramate--L-alanine ligase [Neoehrlichia mikurensis]QXK92690.1 UDP-N-acetylmuramate--L-alanine ligase [Neoehrlichia mikurensis]QXK93928.1 UDP-N-acetylmuramate--L-alanine ligase [Neoehrlichia mikurensis]UTO55911.1 UDP-N-acetylmuramate--L-alanine ligase [Neoehrlichia mikurensis]UTO56827.1 UDP-N-acetylmuramate--L-alanine ligase [Neoehrlichia mikurensis]